MLLVKFIFSQDLSPYFMKQKQSKRAAGVYRGNCISVNPAKALNLYLEFSLLFPSPTGIKYKL